jgi:hypothetical protein
MQLLAQYIEHPLIFERLANAETNQKLRADLESQVQAYRRLAEQRAKKLGLPMPSAPRRVREEV